MSINYKGTNITNVVYKGTTLDYVYKWDGSKYILVFSRKTIYSYTIYLSLSKTSYQVDTSTTTKEWDDWNTEYERLGGVVEDAKKAWDDYPKTHTEPRPYTQAWYDWEAERQKLSASYSAKDSYLHGDLNSSWLAAKKARERAETDASTATSKYNAHHNDPKRPSEYHDIPNPNFDDRVSINNPDYAPWVIEDSKLYHKWQDLIGSPYEASAKAAYEAHHNNPPPTKIPNPDFDDRVTISVKDPAYEPWKTEDDRLKEDMDTKVSYWNNNKDRLIRAEKEWEDEYYRYEREVVKPAKKKLDDWLLQEPTPKDNPDYKKYWDDMSRLEVDYNLAKEAKRKWWGKQPYKWIKETRYDYTVKVSTSRALVDGYIDATFSIGGNNVTVSLRAGESSKSGYYNGTTSNYSSATTKMSTPAGTYDSSVNAGSSINYNLEW